MEGNMPILKCAYRTLKPEEAESHQGGTPDIDPLDLRLHF